MRKFRAVLDTNILLAALITRGTGPDLIFQLLKRGKFILVTSEYQLAELVQVAEYPRIAKRVRPDEVRDMVRYLRAKATLAPENKSVNLSSDPNDNPILAIALNGGAKYVVSRDKPHVLALGKVRGVRILTVGEFLKLLV